MGLYDQMLDMGWRMTEIDACDFLAYLKVRAFRAKRDEEPEGTIDQLPFFGCS